MCPHQHSPGIEAGECCTPARFGGAPYGSARLPVSLLKTVPGPTSTRESREAPRRASSPPRAPGSLSTSAPPKRYGTCPHLCTRVRERHPELISGSSRAYAFNPCATAPLGIEPRGAAPLDVRGGVDPGLLVRTRQCSDARAVIPLPGDGERRPGGHRARHGHLVDVADRLSGSGTDHVHTSALVDVPVSGRTPPLSRIRVWRRARVTFASMMQVCGQFCTGLAELTRVTHCRWRRRARCPPGRRFVSEADATDAISSGASVPHVTASALPSGSC